jgi:diadenosine tetraphosphatase ApaH/serine/threonine PP2A family protein phosphatase
MIPATGSSDFQFFTADELGEEYKLGDGKRMINVGSVGQPRDGDPRACYLIVDDGPVEDADHGALDRPAPARAVTVAFRRISYDFDTTIRKIRGLLD